jgi:hypothetical protein
MSGWCCPSVWMVALQLHAISIIRTGVQTISPWRPDSCDSSPCLALSRIASGRCRPVVLTVAAVFPYLCLQKKLFYLSNIEWRSDGIATSSGRMYLNVGFFWNSEKRPDALLGCPDGCKLEQFKSCGHWWPSGCMTRPSGRKLGIRFHLTWKLHRNFFESWEAHFWNKWYPWICTNIIYK